MSDLALDDDHDLDVSTVGLVLVEDTEDNPDAIAQEIAIALLFHRGEWPLNVLIGIPYMSQVFIKNPSLAAINTLYTRAIRSVPGVLEVPELSTEFDNTTRELTLDFKAKAQNGGVVEDRLAVLLI